MRGINSEHKDHTVFFSSGCIVAAYKRWSFMRGCNNRDLTGKNLVIEVLLYLQALKDFGGKTTFAVAMIQTMQC